LSGIRAQPRRGCAVLVQRGGDAICSNSVAKTRVAPQSLQLEIFATRPIGDRDNEENDMKPACTLIAFLHAKPEKRDELLDILKSFVEPSRSESACVDYHLHVSDDDRNLFIFYENWRTRKELDEHLQTPILTEFWSRRLDLLEKDVEIKFMTMLSDLD
jgi:quinol monooxygenase YgiN